MYLSDNIQVPEYLPQGKLGFWRTFDSTKLNTYLSCPRQYFYNYVLGWRLDVASHHLSFGQAWHSALEHIYNAEKYSPEVLAEAYERFLKVFKETQCESVGGKTPENALRALVEYTNTYLSDFSDFKVLATEVTDTVEIGALWPIVVKLDAVLQSRSNGKIYIMEHKTGSSCGQFWARQWHTSLQVGAYIYACNQVYAQNTTAIIDGTFFLKTKTSFQRELVQKSEWALSNWRNTIQAAMHNIDKDFELLLCTDCPEHKVMFSFPMRPTACSSYTGCSYYDLCTCVANPLDLFQRGNDQPPFGYKEEWWNPLAKTETN